MPYFFTFFLPETIFFQRWPLNLNSRFYILVNSKNINYNIVPEVDVNLNFWAMWKVYGGCPHTQTPTKLLKSWDFPCFVSRILVRYWFDNRINELLAISFQNTHGIAIYHIKYMFFTFMHDQKNCSVKNKTQLLKNAIGWPKADLVVSLPSVEVANKQLWIS